MTLSWRVLVDPPRGGADNMARDEALARTLLPGEAVLRLYAWTRPTLSFGRNEPARERWRGRAGGGEGPVDVVRRPTGGRAVLHDAEVTYAVVVGARALGGPRRVYEAVNHALAAGLRALGAEVDVVSQGAPVLPPDAGPCFRRPASGEIVADGRKLVGSAQARIGKALLQHGSIILSGDQDLSAWLSATEPGGGEPARLEDLIGPVTFDATASAVRAAMRGAFGGDWTDAEYTPEEEELAARLEAERYRSDGWTFRR